jgi:hypothetical protein
VTGIILAFVVAIGALVGWIVVARLPQGAGRSRFDRTFLGTVVAFGVILTLNVIWFITGCIVRVPDIPPLCT